MATKMLIDATHPEETRVVVVDGNKVEDFDFESINKRQLAGNIYLAKVTRVEPSLQAAFVDYGGNRHGFLAFSEVHPDYYQIPVADREALIAEEAAEQERAASREQAREDAAHRAAEGRSDSDSKEDGKGKGRSRRRKRGGRGNDKSAAGEGGNGNVKGLEVIDLEDDETAAETNVEAKPRTVRGLEIAGPDGDAADDAPDSGAVKSAPGAATAGDAADTVIPEVQKGAESDARTPGEAAADADGAHDEADAGEGPKSIAESAGLDGDDDSISEEVADAGGEGEDSDTGGGGDEGDTAVLDRNADADPDAQPAAPQDRRRRRGRSRDRKSGAAEDKAPREKAADKPAAEKPAGDKPAGDKPADAEQTVESIGDDLREEAAKIRARHRQRYKIQDVIKVRQIMLVQVVREERGNKGAALTTYLSLAGRYCVLMPNTARGGGISRKITSAGDRKRLRDITDELEVPQGMGLIVRTAGAERTRAEIKRDYEFLIRQWDQIRELTLKSIAPTLIYEEGSLIKRSIRDLYSKEIDSILVEGDVGYREAKDYMKMLMPSHAKNVQQYAEQIPLFIRYQVESYLNGMFNPIVQLKSGGYIVIGITEALVAIDVNSGRSTRESSIEETALKTNLEAADEVSRQLRLRDLAGLIVIDFIDMEDNRNNRAVEKRMKDRLKTDRARIQVGRISPFGLMEMSRQRLRPGMLEATTQPCPHCHGRGLIRSDENMALSILREVEEEGVRGRSNEITVTAPVGIANYIMNAKRAHLGQIEQRYGIAVSVLGDPDLTSPEFRVERSRSAAPRPPAPAEAVVTAETAAAVSEPETGDEDDDAPEQAATPQKQAAADDRQGGRSRRRRGRRGGQRRRRDGEIEGGEDGAEAPVQSEAAKGTDEAEADDKAGGRRSRRRRRGRRNGQEGEARTAEGGDSGDDSFAPGDEAAEDAAAMMAGGEADAVSGQISESDIEPTDGMPATEADLAPVARPKPDAPVSREPAAEPLAALAEEIPPVPAEEEPAAAEPDSVPPKREPEMASAEPPAPTPEGPPQPKRRGWWQRG